MKTSRRRFFQMTASATAASFTASVSNPSSFLRGEEKIVADYKTSEEDGKTVVRLTDDGRALLNPGMGWVFHHYDNSLDGYGEPLGTNYDGRNFPGLTVVYLRLAWSFLEPEEGVFNWSILDTIIQRYRRMGIRYAFRLTAFEGNKAEDGVPQWLRDAGCPGFLVKPFSEKEHWEVDYTAPLFLEKLERFLNAVGKRYKDDPFLEFVDIGTFGIWGEGHPRGKKYLPEDLVVHFNLHKKAFPGVTLAANDDYIRHFKRPHSGDAGKDEVAQLIDEMGLTLRDDSILVDLDPELNYSAKYAARFWKTRPVILEMAHYSYAKGTGTWGGERYLKAIEDYHAAFASIHAHPQEFLTENDEIIARINRRLGYRFQLLETRFSSLLAAPNPLEITSVWTNAAVAPCLRDVRPIWTLLNDNGDICGVFAGDDASLTGIMPGEERIITSSFPVTPKLCSGRYTVCVSLGTAVGTPTIALPYPSCAEVMDYHREFPAGQKNEVDSLRYPIGTIQVEAAPVLS